MILCCRRYVASAVPFQGIGMTSPLSGDAWACVKRWGAFSEGIYTTCGIVPLLTSVGKAYTCDQAKDDIEDVRTRKGLKLAYRSLQEPRYQ